MKHKGLRYNEGKLRYDLLPIKAEENRAEVMTKGSIKYAPRNWEKGMPWSTVLASLKRHLAAFERGEDYDPESGCLHISHVGVNSDFLAEYYSIYPEGDDRVYTFKTRKKIGLDIDDVLADFCKGYSDRFKVEMPTAWKFDREFMNRIQELHEDKDFFLNLERKVDPLEIPFEPHCYITSRGIPSEWTEQWLDMNGFPTAPVYTVGMEMSKVDVAKQAGIEIYVDDKYENYRELNEAGILTYLFDAPHNQRYDVGYRRVTHLNQLPIEKFNE